jgi:hypothetical protein
MPTTANVECLGEKLTHVYEKIEDFEFRATFRRSLTFAKKA